MPRSATRQFEAEANLLRGIFAPEPIEIEHIGSTAVPGMDRGAYTDAKAPFIQAVLASLSR